jgi:trehalose 6-phosphate synthase/phosphatase
VDDITKGELIEKYRHATNKLVLLDYDGTLVNYDLIPGNAVPSEKLLNVLLRLVDNQRTKVIIISGRGYKEIDKLIGHLPIDIIAEHGAMLKRNGLWEKQLNNSDSWKNIIIPILSQITLRCPGSYVEEKNFSLTWHYRNTESGSGYTNSKELISLLEKYIAFYDLKILDGNKVVEIMSSKIGKGKAVKELPQLQNFDYILSIGDDATDEEVFELFISDANSFTIKVGNGNTLAKYKFDSVSDVVMFLKQLSE